MSYHLPHHLKRLQHDENPNLHSSSYNHHSNSFDNSSRQLDDEVIRESMQHFTVSAKTNTKHSRPFKPGPQRARRGGGRSRDHRWHSGLSLPTRAINYDLAESFVDHSTNLLSSDFYKIKFKHSIKQWPNGRFIDYKEKVDKLDGNIIEITCARTFPTVAKRKKKQEINQNEPNGQPMITTVTPALALLDPVVQEEKKKQVDQQTNFYANLFGVGRIPRISSSTTQIKKTTSTVNSIPLSASSTSISLLDGNSTDQQP